MKTFLVTGTFQLVRTAKTYTQAENEIQELLTGFLQAHRSTDPLNRSFERADVDTSEDLLRDEVNG